VRCWEDGFYGGSFTVNWDGKQVYNSKGKVKFPSDVDLEFQWIKIPAVKLTSGPHTINVAVNGKCGHMHDVIVLTDDPTFKPNVLKALPPVPIAKNKQLNVLAKFKPGLFPDAAPEQWAKPFAGRKLSTLWIVPGICEREIQELTRRLDMQVDVIAPTREYLGRGVFGFNLSMNQLDGLYAILKSPIKRYDVCVMVDVKSDQLTAELQEELVARINAGMGLIWTDSRRNVKGNGVFDALLKKRGEKIQFKKFNSPVKITRLSNAKMFKAGKGRVIKIANLFHGMSNFMPYDDYRTLNYPYQEYLYAKWIELLLVADDWYKQSPYIKNASYDPTSNAIKAVIKTPGGTTGNYTLQANILGPFNRKIKKLSSPTIKVVAGSKTIILQLPKISENGLFRVYLKLLNSSKKIADFSAVDFKNQGVVTIFAITPQKELYQPGEDISLVLSIDNQNRNQAALTLKTSVYGAHNKLISQAKSKLELAPGKQEITKKLKILPTANIAVIVQVELLRNNTLLAKRETLIFVRQQSGANDFLAHTCAWQNKEIPQYLEETYLRIYNLIGIKSARINHGLFCPGQARQGLRWMSIYGLTKSGYCTNAKKGIRSPCFHAPDFWKKETERLSTAGRYVKISPIYLGIGDEENICINDEACFSKYTLAAFRQWLKSTYQSLDKLNREWGTQYKTWDEIQPWKVEQACRRPDNIAPWLDFRVFMTKVFVDRIKKSCKIVKKALPGVPIGGVNPVKQDYLTCAPGSAIYPAIDFATCYPRFFGAAVDFFSVPANANVWTSYNRSDEKISLEMWNAAAHGVTVSGLFGVNRFGYSTLSNSLGLGKRAQALKRIIANLGEGVGKLMINSQRMTSQVAIVRDYRSKYAYTPTIACRNKKTGKILPQSRTYDRIIQCYASYLNARGISYRYISTQQFKAGVLNKYQAVILPHTMLLSAANMQLISKYAGGGGQVFADEMLGKMNEHGKLRTAAELKRLRAFKCSILPIPKKINAKMATLQSALQQAGIKCREQWQGDVQKVVRRQLEKTKTLIVFGSGVIKVKLPSKAYLYNVRTHKFLGHSDRAVMDMSKLPKGSPFVLAELPFKIANVNLSMQRNFKCGDAVNYKLRATPTPGFGSVVRVNIYRPDKTLAADCSANILLRDGVATGQFQLGLNAKTGNWQAVATDVISGKKAKIYFQVK
jgi:Beta-galactosidase